MGAFGKLFQQNNSHNNVFEEQYYRLKVLASQILQYEYAGFEKVLLANKVLPLCNEFLELAGQIDRTMALRKFWKEASEADTRFSYPYHSIFQVTSYGRPDDWDNVIHNVERVKNKFRKWILGLNSFSERLNRIPAATINLLDNGTNRKELVTMPDVKYASVGKAFNKDTLTRFVVVDTETTGLRASDGKIVQLSAVKYVDWEPVEKWDTLINPGNVEIEAEAARVNGLSNEMLVGKPTIEEVSQSFTEFVGDSPVVGYNLPFDL